ncbi:hypothetical protein ACFQZC_09760 [Streptacidiphilus monticola]
MASGCTKASWRPVSSARWAATAGSSAWARSAPRAPAETAGLTTSSVRGPKAPSAASAVASSEPCGTSRVGTTGTPARASSTRYPLWLFQATSSGGLRSRVRAAMPRSAVRNSSRRSQ